MKLSDVRESKAGRLLNRKMNKLDVVVDYFNNRAATLDWEIFEYVRVMLSAASRVRRVVVVRIILYDIEGLLNFLAC